MTRSALFAISAALPVALTLGCGGKDHSARVASDSAAQRAARTTTQVAVATRPASDCDWIPVSEVEAIVGKLAEAPHPGEGGCIYTLPVPQEVLDYRAKIAKVRAAIAKMPGADTADLNKSRPTEIYGFVLEVDLKDDGLRESIAKGTTAMLGSLVNDEGDTADATPRQLPSRDSVRKALGGWDAPGTPYGGRVGHIRISVSPIDRDFDLPREKLDTLAVRVRDRIPDLPFPLDGSSEREARDPCVLVTRQEAEAVLGPLVVAPYRVGKDTPFASADGPGCAYYTAGHHVLILTPRWERGKFNLGVSKTINGLISTVLKDRDAQSADTLEGPWDEAAMGADGRLQLLKGDRSLEIGYRVSSTDESGAVKLARIALPRLAAAKP